MLFRSHTPLMAATKEIFTRNNIVDEHIRKFDYRGNGWPGYFTAYSGNNEIILQKQYSQVWCDILCNSKYINKRCILCHDCTGEYSDISAGDAWLDEYSGKSTGHSVVITRSEISEEVIRHSIQNRSLRLEKTDASTIIQSQKSLLNKKNNLYIKYIISRMIFEKVPEENFTFNKLTNDYRRFPGLLKLFLYMKLINIIRNFKKKIFSQNLGVKLLQNQ